MWDFETIDSADFGEDNSAFEVEPIVEIKVGFLWPMLLLVLLISQEGYIGVVLLFWSKFWQEGSLITMKLYHKFLMMMRRGSKHLAWSVQTECLELDDLLDPFKTSTWLSEWLHMNAKVQQCQLSTSVASSSPPSLSLRDSLDPAVGSCDSKFCDKRAGPLALFDSHQCRLAKTSAWKLYRKSVIQTCPHCGLLR